MPNKLVAPADWKENLNWFESVSESAREKFAKTHCASTFSWEGQTCVVISYPRKNGAVAFYDMDGGEIHWMLLESLSRSERGRTTEEEDFFRGDIMSSSLCDEAADIWFRQEA